MRGKVPEITQRGEHKITTDGKDSNCLICLIGHPVIGHSNNRRFSTGLFVGDEDLPLFCLLVVYFPIGSLPIG